MRKAFSVLLTFLFLFSSCSKFSSSKEGALQSRPEKISYKQIALVHEGAVEVLGAPPSSFEIRHEGLPFSPASSKTPWSRSHQLLFNQIVEIKKEAFGEYLVAIPQASIQAKKQDTPSALQGWVTKHALTTLQQISSQKQSLELLPYKMFQKAVRPSVSLLEPYYSSNLGITFSAATRFVYETKNDKYVWVWAYDHKKKQFVQIALPRSICFFSAHHTRAKQLEDFISILKHWSRVKGGFIPYVFGGASWVQTYKQNDFQKISIKVGKKTFPAFDRKERVEKMPTGMDCSSLIMLAAQMADIPYFAKNTSTLLSQLQEFKKGDRLEPGDLLWIPGHVIIITRVHKKLEFIEARGYGSGYGKIHMLPAAKMLGGINSAKELELAFLNQKILVRLNKRGAVESKESNWKLLKIKSAWKTGYHPNLR